MGYKQVHETAVAPDVVDSRVPVELSQIVMKCLTKNADERYQTGFELADPLLAYLGSAGDSDEMRMAFYSRRPGSSVLAR